jgi:hypothetical protein
MNSNTTDDLPGWNWHIVESGQRWYEAVRAAGQWHPSPDTVERWKLGQAAALIDRLDGACQACVLLWELPADARGFLDALAGITAVADLRPRVIQLAHPEAGGWNRETWHECGMAVQEAGVSVLLADLWSVRVVARRLGQLGRSASNERTRYSPSQPPITGSTHS